MVSGIEKRTRGVILKRSHPPIVLPLFVILILSTFNLPGQSLSQELKTGWYPNFPYQMEERHDEVSRVTGLDYLLAESSF